MKFRFLLASRLFLVGISFLWIGKAFSQSAPLATPRPRLHLLDFHIRDPWILADTASRTYYLYATNSDQVTGVHRAGVMVYKSRNLRNWETPFLVFTLPDGTWADPPVGAWAPEVHPYHGKFYLFVTLHNPSKIIAAQPAVRRTNFMRATPFGFLNPARRAFEHKFYHMDKRALCGLPSMQPSFPES